MFRSIALTVALFAIACPAAGIVSAQAAPAAPAASTVRVSIKMFAFTPQLLAVTPGTTVVWTNADEDPHTVTATDRSFRSAALDTGDTFSFTFTRPGVYSYFCTLHPHMTGKVVVKA